MVEVDFDRSSTGVSVVQVKVEAAGGESDGKDDNIHIKHNQAKETHMESESLWLCTWLKQYAGTHFLLGECSLFGWAWTISNIYCPSNDFKNMVKQASMNI